jgi:hypothetical protein
LLPLAVDTFSWPPLLSSVVPPLVPVGAGCAGMRPAAPFSPPLATFDGASGSAGSARR